MIQKLKDLWNKDKFLFIGLAALLLLATFRDAIIDLLVGSARNIGEKAQEKNNDLKAKEDAANQQAEALLQDIKAKENQPPVTDVDWYKKK